MYDTGVSHEVMSIEVTSVSKYHITDKNCEINVGKHPLVTTAKKASWQMIYPLPRYCGTYDIKNIPRFIENLWQKKLCPWDSCPLKQSFWLCSLLCGGTGGPTEPISYITEVSMNQYPDYLYSQNEESDGLGCSDHLFSGWHFGQTYRPWKGNNNKMYPRTGPAGLMLVVHQVKL